MIGQTFGRYRILDELGSGGMGTVYLAEDTRLGRKVALKVLPEEPARDPERRARFEREARAVASLNHPNIVVIHSVEEERGIPFITMEHVTGRRLTTLLAGGGMRLRDFFAIGVPLADAVHAAHRQGVTHRDLKPDNVMINDEGRVKVLDFGLAKLFEPGPADHGMTMAVGDAATREGRILGTAAYMSPEQAEGKAVDARTDIFSLGVVFFEMLTGRRPFVGDSQMSTLSSVLRDTPPPVTELNPGLPRHLARIVSRCLAKDADRRYQTALDVRNELEALKEEVRSDAGSTSALASGASAAGGGPASVAGYAAPQPTPYPSSPAAPTPYPPAGASGSGAPSAAPPPPSTAGGIGAPARRAPSPLVMGLGAVAVLAIAATGFFALRGRGDEGAGRGAARVATAAAKGARAEKSIVVLPFENLGPPEDAYFAAGITDEITSRLASVSGLTVLSRTTASQYDKTGKTVRDIGNDLGVTYVLEGTVRWEKSGNGTSRVRVVPQLIRASDDSHVWSDRYEESMEEIFRIQSAIAARVVDALGVTLLEPARLALSTKLTDNIDAYHAYLKALEYTEGIRFDESILRRGIDMLARATELDPGFVVAHAMLAKTHAALIHYGFDSTPERLAMADAEVKQVEGLDPTSPWASYARGWVAYWGRKDLETAIREMERVREGLPGNVDVLEAIGFVRRRQGRYEEGLENLRQAADRDPRDTRLLWGVAETSCLLDRFDQAITELEPVISLAPDASDGYRLMAMVHLARGDFAEARRWVARAPVPDDPLSTLILNFELAFYEGRLDEALAAAAKLPDLEVEQFGARVRSLSSGLAEVLLGDAGKARPHFEAARARLEAAVRERPEDSRLRASLGIAWAGLGNREAALREARKAFETYPATHDAWIRSGHESELAYVYMLLGDRAAAVAQWKTVMESPGEFIPSRALLRGSPVFESLRGDPEFRKLVAAES